MPTPYPEPSQRLDAWLARMREEDKEFYQALGQFMLGWADVESTLGEVLRKYAKVSEPVARALFSGTRARTMISFINAIADNTRVSKARKDDLTFLFAKIATLNTQRDRIAHYGSYRSPSLAPNSLKRRVSNDKRSSRTTNSFVQFVGSEELRYATGECLRLCEALKQHLTTGRFQRTYWPERPRSSPVQRGKAKRAA